MLVRKPREACKSLDDLTAQLSEFDLRCEAQDYDTAAALLLEFDSDCLFLWGHYGLMTDLHERLQGKITDPELTTGSVGNLGSAYIRMGRLQRAMVCYEEALRLARENHDPWGEGVWLGNLGTCFLQIGQTARGIKIYEQALQVRRDVGDRKGESLDLLGLAIFYDNLGLDAQALIYYRQAIKIDREIGNKVDLAANLLNFSSYYIKLGRTIEATDCLNEGLALAQHTSHRLVEGNLRVNTGELELLRENYGEAKDAFEKAIEIADEIGSAQSQGAARRGVGKPLRWRSGRSAPIGRGRLPIPSPNQGYGQLGLAGSRVIPSTRPERGEAGIRRGHRSSRRAASNDARALCHARRQGDRSVWARFVRGH
ncbi:MAG: tetratricopeptide repeat protein [Acetobacteraceae bacterium]|nr:tetratricopeptide repeat protein [Acetobacteraceae bacterium]